MLIVVAMIAIVTVVGGLLASGYHIQNSPPLASQPSFEISNVRIFEQQRQYDSSGNCLNETLAFSFTLTNSGNSNGFARVVLREANNQTQLWTNNFFVKNGESLPWNAQAHRQGCTPFAGRFWITSQCPAEEEGPVCLNQNH